MLIQRLKHSAFIASQLYLIFWLKYCYNVSAILYISIRQMTLLQNLEKRSKSDFATASPDEEYLCVTKKESTETKNSKSFRGCEYQTVADGVLSLAMLSTIS